MKKKSSSKKTSSSNNKKKSSSKNQKRNFAQIGQYLVAKSGTKYLKLGVNPKKASKEAKALVKKLIAALGTDVIFLNVFDADFREKYNIQDFVKGSMSVDLDAKLDSDDDDSDDDQDDADDDSDDSDDDDEDSDDSDDDDEDDSDDDDDDESF